MAELFGELLKAQPDVLLMLAGLILIGIGVVGSVKSYIDPGKWGRIGALGMGVILLTVGVTLHARELGAMAKSAISPAKPAIISSICTFDAGPLAGKTAQLPETALAAIGSPCNDTSGNKGYIVAPDTPLSPHEAQAALPRPQPPPSIQSSRVCHFDTGPLAGSTRELPRDRLQAVGEPCHNLQGSRGLIVAPDTPLTP